MRREVMIVHRKALFAALGAAAVITSMLSLIGLDTIIEALISPAAVTRISDLEVTNKIQMTSSSGPTIRTIASNPNGSVVEPRGSLRLRTDVGNSSLYVNTDGATSWSTFFNVAGDHLFASGSTISLDQIGTQTFLGRTAAGTGNAQTLTATQSTAILDTFTSGAKGLAPASGGGTTNFLRADGTWSNAIDAVSAGIIYGDAAQGDVTLGAGTTTLTADQFYNNLTINVGDTLATGGYRVYVKGTLTLNGTISRSGNAGTAGNGTTPGTGGASSSAGVFSATSAGGNGVGAATGGTGGDSLSTPRNAVNGHLNGGAGGTSGNNGTNATANLASIMEGGGGGGGGGGDGGTGGTGGNGGKATRLANNYGFDMRTYTTMSTGTAFDGNTWVKGTFGSGGAGGGGASNAVGTSGGYSGGGGAGGGNVYLAAYIITGTGSVEAKGGNGGNGGNGIAGNGAGGGGGGGGAGGVVVVVTRVGGTLPTISVSGGNGGNGGTKFGGGGGGNGGNGAQGAPGYVISYNF